MGTWSQVKLSMAAIVVIVAATLGVASAVPNFVDNNLPLPGNKTDRLPCTNPAQQWCSADANTVFGYLADLRTVALRAPISAQAFGAKCNNSNDDAGAINAAIAAAAATINGTFGATVDLPKGTCLVSAPVLIPNGVRLRGSGTASTSIKAATFNATPFSAASVVANSNQTGSQEFAVLESLTVDANRAGGATVSDAAVTWGSLFINSYIRDVLIQNSSGVGLHVTASNAAGPVLVENVWVVNNTSHGVLVEDLVGNTQAMNGIVFINLTSEHQGTGASAVYLKGNGHAQGWAFYNTHIEMASGPTGRTGVTIDGVSDVLFRGVQLLTSGGVTQGILITNVSQNVRISLFEVTNANVINPVLLDSKDGVSIGAVNLPAYVTPDVFVAGGMRFRPAGSTATGMAVQDSAGTDRVIFNGSGQLAGNSVNGAGLDIVGDATNNRPLLFVPSSASGLTNIYGYYYPSGGGGVFRERSFTGGADVRQIGTAGDQFFYQPLTVQGNTTFQSKVAASGGSAPTIGSCGTGPSVLAGSTDFAGSFTTGSAATTCTVTFSSAFSGAPTCMVSANATVIPTYTTSTTAMTLTVDVASTTYRYFCVGH